MASLAKMSTEETFYEHLTLGLLKVLNSIPRVTNVMYERRIACERSQVTAWEQRHNIYLPDDMKRFYLSTDGFHLHWSYQYSNNDTRKVGQIYIPHLIEISLMRDNIELNDTTLNPTLTYLSTTLHRSAIVENNRSPTLNARSKVFELKNILDLAKVCLVFESPETNPKIFLFEINNMKWKFLADSFSEYLRMYIAHMGLPYWELCFSSCELPSWTEQLFLLVAPHLLEKTELRRSLNVKQNSDCPIYNVLETSVFRTKPTKCSRQNPKQKNF